MPQGCARYLLRLRDVARERERHMVATGNQRRALAKDLRVAQREAGLEIGLSEPALVLACEQAEAGDQDAEAALAAWANLDAADVLAEAELRRRARNGRGAPEPLDGEAPADLVILRETLAYARSRGEPFEAAWRAALDGWPPSAWRTAAEGTTSAWRDAFECRGGDPVRRLFDAFLDPEHHEPADYPAYA